VGLEAPEEACRSESAAVPGPCHADDPNRCEDLVRTAGHLNGESDTISSVEAWWPAAAARLHRSRARGRGAVADLITDGDGWGAGREDTKPSNRRPTSLWWTRPSRQRRRRRLGRS